MNAEVNPTGLLTTPPPFLLRHVCLIITLSTIQLETLRTITKYCHTTILFCNGPNQWAPPSHADDILESQRKSNLPNNIEIVREYGLLHDFIVHREMVPVALEFIVGAVMRGSREAEGLEDDVGILSRL